MRIVGFDGKTHYIQRPTTEGLWPLVHQGVRLNLRQARIPDPIDPWPPYRKEPRRPDGSRDDRFRTVRELFSDGWGDCEDFAAWAAAWLQAHGIDADVALIQWPGGGWHAVTWAEGIPDHWLEAMGGDGYYRVEDLPKLYKKGVRVYVGPRGWNPPGIIIDMARHHGMRDSAWPREVSINAISPEPALEGDDYYQTIGGLMRSPATMAIGVAMLGAAIVANVQQAGQLPWQGRYPAEFGRAVVNIARSLGTRPDWLLAVIRLESNFRLKAENPKTRATGLLQWTPNTAADLGTTVEAIANMGWMEQARLIHTYLRPYKGRVYTLERLYQAVFRPKTIGQEVMANRGTDAYEWNKGLDADNDGRITAVESAAKLRAYLADEAGIVGGVSGVAELDALRREIQQASTFGQASVMVRRWASVEADPGRRASLERKAVTLSKYPGEMSLVDSRAPGDMYQQLDTLAHLVAQVARSHDPSWSDTIKNAALATAQTVLDPVAAHQQASTYYGAHGAPVGVSVIPIVIGLAALAAFIGRRK